MQISDVTHVRKFIINEKEFIILSAIEKYLEDIRNIRCYDYKINNK